MSWLKRRRRVNKEYREIYHTVYSIIQCGWTVGYWEGLVVMMIADRMMKERGKSAWVIMNKMDEEMCLNEMCNVAKQAVDVHNKERNSIAWRIMALLIMYLPLIAPAWGWTSMYFKRPNRPVV